MSAEAPPASRSEKLGFYIGEKERLTFPKPLSSAEYSESRSLTPESEVFAMLPLDSVHRPRWIPTVSSYVEQLKATMHEVSGSTNAEIQERSNNGLLTPVWIIRLPDGSHHIADGFHRYDAQVKYTSEIKAAGNTPREEIFARVIPGDEELLWQLRLIFAGDHTNVAPARFIMFLKESWARRYPDIPFSHAAQFLVNQEQLGDKRYMAQHRLNTLKNHPKGVDGFVFGQAVSEMQGAVTMVRINDPTEVRLIAEIGGGLHEDLLDKIRREAKKEDGEIPLALAKAIAKQPALMIEGNRQHQLTIMNAYKLMDLDHRTMFETISEVGQTLEREDLTDASSVIKSVIDRRKAQEKEPETSSHSRKQLMIIAESRWQLLNNLRSTAILRAWDSVIKEVTSQPDIAPEVFFDVFYDICQTDLLLSMCAAKIELTPENCDTYAKLIAQRLVSEYRVMYSNGGVTKEDLSEKMRRLISENNIKPREGKKKKNLPLLMHAYRTTADGIPVDYIIKTMEEFLNQRFVPASKFNDLKKEIRRLQDELAERDAELDYVNGGHDDIDTDDWEELKGYGDIYLKLPHVG